MLTIKLINNIHEEWMGSLNFLTPFYTFLEQKYGIHQIHNFHPINEHSFKITNERKFMIAQLKFGDKV